MYTTQVWEAVSMYKFQYFSLLFAWTAFLKLDWCQQMALRCARTADPHRLRDHGGTAVHGARSCRDPLTVDGRRGSYRPTFDVCGLSPCSFTCYFPVRITFAGPGVGRSKVCVYSRQRINKSVAAITSRVNLNRARVSVRYRSFAVLRVYVLGARELSTCPRFPGNRMASRDPPAGPWFACASVVVGSWSASAFLPAREMTVGPMARNGECKKFSPNIFNKSKCTNCFRQKEEHSAEALESNRVSLS